MTTSPRSITVGTGQLENGCPVIVVTMIQSTGSRHWQYMSFREARALGQRLIETTSLGLGETFADERFRDSHDAAIAEHEGRE